MEAIHAIQSRPSREGAARILEAAGLPSQDLTDTHFHHFFYVGDTLAPNGLIGLELYGAHALLRSLVIAPDHRQRGLATALVAHAERYAHSQGVTSIYLLTTTAEDFFKKRGYVAADRASAPRPIRATREFADLCPASSAFLKKTLSSVGE
jgi:amino-acid N-acetyltransferase